MPAPLLHLAAKLSVCRVVLYMIYRKCVGFGIIAMVYCYYEPMYLKIYADLLPHDTLDLPIILRR